ncbi:MAG: copper-binding protein [Acidobacteriota bacterium]|nr:copper-binding protein [Acidobacteriota bacterium]
MKLLTCLLCALLLMGCQRNPPPLPVKEYQLQGEVVSVDPMAQTATVKGGKIEGWMEAMTMEYPVKDKAEFSKLKAGEKIQAKVLVQGTDYWIAGVSKEPVK